MTSLNALSTRLRLHYNERQNRTRIASVARQVADHASPTPGRKPLIIFNVSSRLTGLSLNASFSQLTAWSLRLEGVPVVHFVCQSGMQHCVLGTNRQDYTSPPPCESCIAQSRRLYTGADTHWFYYHSDPSLAATIGRLNVEELGTFAYELPLTNQSAQSVSIPLGELVMPSIRWALRRYHLPDDEATRYLLRSYILSAYSIATQFMKLLNKVQPAAVVIFNGSIYPEATVRWVTSQVGVRVITHEVGFQHLSTFFTDGQATAYPIQIPEQFELTEAQNTRLNNYLENRFQGNFTMAGIQFWPEMRGLDEPFLEKASQFQQIVPVFTNVVYDTSQAHASVVFSNMFAWLDLVLEIIRSHPDTLFVIRAHPDEMREGTAKLSNESVQDWVITNQVDQLPNVIFISPVEYISSYDLIHHSRFVIVYNSSIGLEAALLGKAVVCGGKARYTQYPTVYFPETRNAFRDQVESMLAAEGIEMPANFQRNARRFLYHQLYRTSLPMGTYLESLPRAGFVRLKEFSWQQLLPENSPTMQIIHDGILHGNPFLLPEEN